MKIIDISWPVHEGMPEYGGRKLCTFTSYGNETHKIICFDTDTEKTAKLISKNLYIYEPQLEDLLFNSLCSKNISFTHNFNHAMDSEIFFICVPTPTNLNGDCDCSYLYSAFNTAF
ncbi:MAG: hypothetical protein WDZ41_02520 [Candidatus Babeliales bacterium]